MALVNLEDAVYYGYAAQYFSNLFAVNSIDDISYLKKPIKSIKGSTTLCPVPAAFSDAPAPPLFISTKFSLGCTSPDPFNFVDMASVDYNAWARIGPNAVLNYFRQYGDDESSVFVSHVLNYPGLAYPSSPNPKYPFKLPLVYGDRSQITLGRHALIASDLTKANLKENANNFKYMIESQSEASPLRIVYSYWLYNDLGGSRGIYKDLEWDNWPRAYPRELHFQGLPEPIYIDPVVLPDWATPMLDLDWATHLGAGYDKDYEFGQNFYYYANRDAQKYMARDTITSISFNSTAVNELLSQEIYLDKTNFKPENAKIIVDQEARLQRGPGVVAHDQTTIVSSDTCRIKWLAGSEDQCIIQYSIEQGTTVTTTNGTESSSSNEQEASMDIGLGIETEAEPFGIGVKTSLEVTNGYKNSIENLQSVNFSKQTSSTKNSTRTATRLIDRGSVKKNSDGTYPYKEGVFYKASITQLQSNIKTPFKGDYKIGGYLAGTIVDSSSEKNQISMSPALALNVAFDNNYQQVVGNDINSVGDLDPDLLEIDFHGTASGLTLLSTESNVTFTEDSNQSESGYSGQDNSTNTDDSSQSTSGTDQIPSARKFKKSSNVHTDLNEFDSTRRDRIGVHHVFPKKSLGSKSVSGTGHTDIVYASKKGSHTFKDFKNSFLHGNKNKDIYIFDKNSSGNNIEAFAGNDRIKSASTQYADLGPGDDTYKIMAKARPNSFHSFLSGDGHDKLVVASDKAEFRIGDFNPFMDKVITGGSLKPELLTSKLVSNWDKYDTLDSARIDFKYDGNLIGTAHLSSDPDVINSMASSKFHKEMAILNHKFHGEKIDGVAVFDILATSVKNGVTQKKQVTHDAWQSFNNKKRSRIIHQSIIGTQSDNTKKDWFNWLEAHDNPGEFSLDMFNQQT